MQKIMKKIDLNTASAFFFAGFEGARGALQHLVECCAGGHGAVRAGQRYRVRDRLVRYCDPLATPFVSASSD